MIKKYIPYWFKIQLRLLLEMHSDFRNGYYFNFAKIKENSTNFSNSISTTQKLKPNDAKKINLELAIKSIEKIEIHPGEIFSFWKTVRKPSKQNGFVGSRSLVNGEIEDSLGGGLCQLSGLIYYCALIGNFEILERHNHSIDIYTNETRFTPLGSDATVAYGYKDLKIRNDHSSPIKFKFLMEEHTLSIYLLHNGSIIENKVQFDKKQIDKSKMEVTTLINGEIKAKSIYST